jgi:hypothetical protein
VTFGDFETAWIPECFGVLENHFSKEKNSNKNGSTRFF